MKSTLAIFAGAVAMTTHTALTLSSTSFPNNGKIPAAQAYDQGGCGGQNVSPALAWSGVPSGTKSLAIIMFDPDARKGQGWTHWVAYGIDPARGSLSEGAGSGAASGVVQGKTGFPTPGYGGPCPPVGDPPHHYVFTLYALDLAPTALQAGLDRDGLLNATKGHSLGTAQYTGLYQRMK